MLSCIGRALTEFQIIGKEVMEKLNIHEDFRFPKCVNGNHKNVIRIKNIT